jgi:cardiolipin synthase
MEVRLRWRINHRDHRKLLLVDGKIAFLGGINISAVYSSGISLHKGAEEAITEPMRDTDVEIEGPVVAQCQELFLAEWVSEGGAALAPPDYYPIPTVQGDEIVRVIGSVPERFSLIYVTLISAISNAEKNVWITDAYFAPEPQLVIALEDAARHGVDVRLVLPSITNEPLILAAGRSYYSELMDAGVKVYELQGAMLHAKTATIDGVWSTVGSSNLDPWSILHNNEINAVILSPSFGLKMNLMFDKDMSNAKEITPQAWQARGLIERAHEEVARILQPIL